ncbi:hypothetical protein B0J11DRAFT_469470 [Dendryphion nanum]|uniref:Radical SAM core domain-containing protein n=1 Tax=Dendryphion nanum TaxID=256645 RepID=A0A9P9DAY3_9PLEO|nr:hypothetical protein B0J11DRAFT_469470 [Dendryphion nanum]
MSQTIRGVMNIPFVVVHSRRNMTSTSAPDRPPYWQVVPQWQDVSEQDFVSYRWQVRHTVGSTRQLVKFLDQALPETLAEAEDKKLRHVRSKSEFIQEALDGLAKAPMSIRITPHILSRINWNNPLDDQIRRQFIPLKSSYVVDHAQLTLDSLHEQDDSPVDGLVHRYPDKALFLATSICPTYCRFCTRAHAVGANTETVTKAHQKPTRRRWELVYQYIEKTDQLTDIVVSGGDVYMLQPSDVQEIADRLLSIPHIKRIRFASKGISVLPARIIDPNDHWAETLISISNRARREGKHVCLHTHFDHPSEITWVTRAAAQKLWENGVVVRNQSVLLRGVNDTAETMGKLIRDLADINIQPYYVYQCDLVRGIEDLRTPLKTILDIEQHLRGTIAGFMMPSFVVDLPGGGGKRLATSHEEYDQTTGISTFRAPGLHGEKGQRLYKYYDPHPEPIAKEGPQPTLPIASGISLTMDQNPTMPFRPQTPHPLPSPSIKEPVEWA